jgi:hypothetical protein
VRLRTRAVGARVLHAHQHVLGDLTWSWGTAIASDIGDDYGALANTELSAMVLTDPHTLDEAERS